MVWLSNNNLHALLKCTQVFAICFHIIFRFFICLFTGWIPSLVAVQCEDHWKKSADKIKFRSAVYFFVSDNSLNVYKFWKIKENLLKFFLRSFFLYLLSSTRFNFMRLLSTVSLRCALLKGLVIITSNVVKSIVISVLIGVFWSYMCTVN